MKIGKIIASLLSLTMLLSTGCASQTPLKEQGSLTASGTAKNMGIGP